MSQIAEDIARKLENSEYREFHDDVIHLALENNVVIISGASDDIIELNGAINDEISPGDFRLTRKGLLEPIKEVIDQATETLDYARKDAETSVISSMRNWLKAYDSSVVVTGIFGIFGDGWHFTADPAYPRFTILEDGEVHSRGLVIDLNELQF